MERFYTSLGKASRRLAHLLLLLLLLCGTLYVAGCPKCKPEYKPTTTEDEEDDETIYRHQHQQEVDKWIEEIDNGGGERGDGMRGSGLIPGGSLSPF